MEDEIVILVCNGYERTFDFQHALEILRTDKKKQFKPVGKHKFVNNELIIKPSPRGGKKSTKQGTSKEGSGLSESTKDSDKTV